MGFVLSHLTADYSRFYNKKTVNPVSLKGTTPCSPIGQHKIRWCPHFKFDFGGTTLEWCPPETT